ncbi:MAG TPA: XdhC/CoxI family protein [Acidimicrobiales bacterium]|nr:XdhC/CoxI family protein [Acidimicrobiales bacterium]
MSGELYHELQEALRASEPVVLATMIIGPPEQLGHTMLVRPGATVTDPPVVIGTLGQADLDRAVERDALGELEVGRTGTRHYGPEGQARENAVSIFIESFAPPPKMIIFGAVDFTAALGKVAKILGYWVIVCDPRPIFATAKRFPMADEIAIDWPNRYLEKVGPSLTGRDCACVLTHDAKLDVPAIRALLATKVGYLGVMGNRRTHENRIERLRDVGVTDEQIARLMAPIGLDIGSRTPEETAIAICAEIIARRSGHDVPSLRDRPGPIHATPAG